MWVSKPFQRLTSGNVIKSDHRAEAAARMKGTEPVRNLSLTTIIVVALLTLFIPSCAHHRAYNEMKVSGNEAAAIKTLQALAVDQSIYFKQHRGSAYGTFDQLITDVDLDKKYAGDTPAVSGYIFTLKVTPKSSSQPAFYSINADPQNGEGRHFYVDASLDMVKVNDKQPATPDDPPVAQE